MKVGSEGCVVGDPGAVSGKIPSPPWIPGAVSLELPGLFPGVGAGVQLWEPEEQHLWQQHVELCVCDDSKWF